MNFSRKEKEKQKAVIHEIIDAEEEKRKIKQCRAEGKNYHATREVARTLQGRKSPKNKKALNVDIRYKEDMSEIYAL